MIAFHSSAATTGVPEETLYFFSLSAAQTHSQMEVEALRLKLTLSTFVRFLDSASLVQSGSKLLSSEVLNSREVLCTSVMSQTHPNLAVKIKRVW